MRLLVIALISMGAEDFKQQNHCDADPASRDGKGNLSRISARTACRSYIDAGALAAAGPDQLRINVMPPVGYEGCAGGERAGIPAVSNWAGACVLVCSRMLCGPVATRVARFLAGCGATVCASAVLDFHIPDTTVGNCVMFDSLLL
jgi:hypothetical protein